MREIKFRAWHKESKRMFQIVGMKCITPGESAQLQPVKVATFDSHNGYSERKVCPDDVILLQYTNLTGPYPAYTEIYEGDIIKTVPWSRLDSDLVLDGQEYPSYYQQFKSSLGIVFFDSYDERWLAGSVGHLGEEKMPYGYRTEFRLKRMTGALATYVKVLGNAYQNPEMLETNITEHGYKFYTVKEQLK